MSTHFQQVHQFNTAARGELPVNPATLDARTTGMCLNLINEEFGELIEATLADGATLDAAKQKIDELTHILKNLAEEDLNRSPMKAIAQLDACVDIEVVTLGFSAMHGLPHDEGFAEVQGSNMAKIDPETGRCIKNEFGKIQKPEGWTPPDLAAVVLKHVGA
ncbi:hypothetical protein [Cupriavidus sp. DL-D2]|uniref:hypothetical protein n=1 Tax=Cupriavidus sp. DL-D2 TaxID=3144974 RepID=UPI003215B495